MRRKYYDNLVVDFGLIHIFIEEVGRGKGDIYQDCGNFYFIDFFKIRSVSPFYA